MEGDNTTNRFSVGYQTMEDLQRQLGGSTEPPAEVEDTTEDIVEDQENVFNNEDDDSTVEPIDHDGGEVVEEDVPGEETTEEGGEETEEVSVNPYYAVALHLKEDGVIPDDFEFDDTVGYSAIEPFVEQKVSAKIEARLEEEYTAIYGDEDTRMYARLLRQGADPDQVKQVNQFKQIAELKGQEDVTVDIKKAVIANMYALRNMDETEYSVLIERAEAGENGELDALYNKGIEFHEGQYNTIKAEEAKHHQLQKQQLREAQVQSEKQIKDILQNKKVLTFDFSDEQAQKLQKAIYQKDREFEYHGQKLRGTEMDEFLANFQSSNELKILAYLLINHPEKMQKVAENKAKLRIEDQLLQSKQTKVIKRAPTEKKPNPQLPKPHKVY